jgi:hypothetical protein
MPVMRCFLREIVSAAFLCTAAAAAPPSRDVVAAAKRLAAEQFDGFTYGAATERKQINCVQFTGAVTEALLQRSLSAAEKDALYIRYRFDDLNAAVAAGDPRTKGIQRAIAEVMNAGTAVAPAAVQPGDFVQYWIRKKDGNWAGHSAIVTKVISDHRGPAAIAIFSSNQSTNGIAEMDFGGRGLNIRGDDRRFYFARLHGWPVKTR